MYKCECGNELKFSPVTTSYNPYSKCDKCGNEYLLVPFRDTIDSEDKFLTLVKLFTPVFTGSH